MEWMNDMLVIILVGLANIVASVGLGSYWLKHERFPWEKPQTQTIKTEEHLRHQPKNAL